MIESPQEKSVEILSPEQIARKTIADLAEAHFTTATRKEAEVNEGGLVDAAVSSRSYLLPLLFMDWVLSMDPILPSRFPTLPRPSFLGAGQPEAETLFFRQ